MEVVIPVPATDFHFDSNASSPYITAPSSPKRFGDFLYFSAPTSPTRISSSIYHHQFDSSIVETNTTPSSPSSIPFHWEEKPGKPKPAETDPESDHDFAFDFSGHLDKPPLKAAEELFDHGKIRPLKPPPRLQLGFGDEPRKSPVSSPKRIFRNAFTPRGRKEVDVDPFAAAIEETRRGSDGASGRERETGVDPSNPTRRGTRSLSPFRVTDSNPKSSSSSSTSSSSSSSSSSKWGGRKWRLKDFLLFRSASEGRATDKDPLRKYALLTKKGSEDVKNASFRSTDSGGSVSGSKRIGTVSAHELHYTANRAVSEELKKKTFLPYKQGLLGCLGFNPSGSGLAKGFDSLTRVQW